jgi:hypothetical protein
LIMPLGMEAALGARPPVWVCMPIWGLIVWSGALKLGASIYEEEW